MVSSLRYCFRGWWVSFRQSASVRAHVLALRNKEIEEGIAPNGKMPSAGEFLDAGAGGVI
jgi:hypothetical protein